MATSINLDDELVAKAKSQAKIYSRSMAKQIEHWARIGRIAEENPTITYEKIKEILISQYETKEDSINSQKSAKIK